MCDYIQDPWVSKEKSQVNTPEPYVQAEMLSPIPLQDISEVRAGREMGAIEGALGAAAGRGSEQSEVGGLA